MPRPRNFFRFENASKDSGLSFHCCGKPEDLLDEPLDLINERRRTGRSTGNSSSEVRINERQLDSLLAATLCNDQALVKESTSTEILSPVASSTSSSHWSLQSFLFWPTPLSSHSKRNSKVKKSKFWCKKYGEPSIASIQRAAPSGSFCREAGQSMMDEVSAESSEPKLRSARSMPLLSNPIGFRATPRNRCLSKCLSQLSFSGVDRLVATHYHQERPIQDESGEQHLNLNESISSRPSDSYHTAYNDRPNVSSAKAYVAVACKPSKIPGFLSLPHWAKLFSNRHEKDKKFFPRYSSNVDQKD